jgi:3-oxoacyl-(acyl-carrier-protein) synthase
MNAVAITGMAVSSPFGKDFGALWIGVCEGPTPLSLWSAPGLDGSQVQAALLPETLKSSRSLPERMFDGTEDLIDRALSNAGLKTLAPSTGLALGSVFGETDYLTVPRSPRPASLLPRLARRFGLFGPVVNTATGCAAGNQAMAFARDQILSGRANTMLAGGFDLLGPAAALAFSELGAFTESLPRPFAQDRDGFLYGEGGAVFVLESMEHARARGARLWGVLGAAACTHDAAHPTRPVPAGDGTARAIVQALREADLKPADIGYVNAHSPGTRPNDPAEAKALERVFGARAIPVSSTKGALGHAQGGANALEAALCLLALERQVLPPTLNTRQVDPALSLDVVLEARPHRFSWALSNAAGMGGANGVVLLGRDTNRTSTSLRYAQSERIPGSPQSAPVQGEPVEPPSRPPA